MPGVGIRAGCEGEGGVNFLNSLLHPAHFQSINHHSELDSQIEPLPPPPPNTKSFATSRVVFPVCNLTF